MSENKAFQVARFGGEKLKEGYARYEKFLPAASFLAGTVWDVLTLGRIDQLLNLVQLGVYLLIVAALLGAELIDGERPFQLTGVFGKAWQYRDEVVHFFLGSLLSAFTLFYLKSASIISSMVFFLVIAACLVGNEFSAMRRLGLVMRTVLFAITATSYLFCVTPLIYSSIGWLPFLTALVLSAMFCAALCYLLNKKVATKVRLKREIIYPYAGVLVAFFLFYLFRIIPPVPLSLTHVGIYHKVERVEGGYEVTTTRPRWKFWQSGDQSFAAKPGDRLFCFFSVFAPGGFKETIKVRWLRRDDLTGWESSDAVPVSISGGREEGFRGFTFKQNYQPGHWQVRIETSDGREIGRIGFTVATGEAESDAEELKETL